MYLCIIVYHYNGDLLAMDAASTAGYDIIMQI